MLIAHTLCSALHRWSRDRRGAAAIEFAFAAPAFIVLMLAGVDTTRYATATRRVEAVAATIGQMVAVSTTGQMAPADLQFYTDSTMVIFPMVLQDSFQQQLVWSNDIAITVSSVTFTGTAPIFIATTKWSVGPNLRACTIPLVAASDTASPSPATLPADTFGAGTLIVVDVKFTFRPMLAAALLKPLPIVRSFYVQPRYLKSISYTGVAGPQVTQC